MTGRQTKGPCLHGSFFNPSCAVGNVLCCQMSFVYIVPFPPSLQVRCRSTPVQALDLTALQDGGHHGHTRTAPSRNTCMALYGSRREAFRVVRPQHLPGAPSVPVRALWAPGLRTLNTAALSGMVHDFSGYSYESVNFHALDKELFSRRQDSEEGFVMKENVVIA